MTRLLLIVVAVVVSGCAGFSRTISKEEQPAPTDAVLYGRFSITGARGNFLALDRHETMGFSIKCANGDMHVVRFSMDEPLQVIKIAPSTCQFADIVYTNVDGMVRSRKPAPKLLTQYVEFSAGKAYYLGDFFALMSHSRKGLMHYTVWEIKSIKDDYALTSEEFKKTFPRLSAMPTENRMIGKRTSDQAGIIDPI